MNANFGEGKVSRKRVSRSFTIIHYISLLIINCDEHAIARSLESLHRVICEIIRYPASDRGGINRNVLDDLSRRCILKIPIQREYKSVLGNGRKRRSQCT